LAALCRKAAACGLAGSRPGLEAKSIHFTSRRKSEGEQQHALEDETGADWCRRGSSAVLAVPSAVIPSETNYLLNPLHPAFARIAIGAAEDFVTDLRLIRK